MKPIIRVEYDLLRKIQLGFGDQVDKFQSLYHRLHERTELLKQYGYWVGDSAEIFYTEMDKMVLPALHRTYRALQEAEDTVRQIIEIMDYAEEEAGRKFDILGTIGQVQGVASADHGKEPSPDSNGRPKVISTRRDELFQKVSHLFSDLDKFKQGDPPPPEGDDELLRETLRAYLGERYQFFFYYFTQTHGEDASFEELVEFMILMEGFNTPEDAAWYFIGKDPLNFLWIINVEAARNFPRFWAEAWENRSPEDYRRTWEAFWTWFTQDGVRSVNDPADLIYSFEDWMNGEGSFWGVVLSAGPLSASTVGRIINGIDSPALREALQGLIRNGDDVPLDQLLETLIRHADGVGQANLAHIARVAGDNFANVMRNIDERGLIRVLTDPDLLRTLGTTTNGAEIARLINVSVLTDTIPGINVIIDDLNLLSTQRLLNILDSGGTLDPTHLALLTERLDADRANDFLRQIDDTSLARMFADDGIVVGDDVAGLDNATYDVSRNTSDGTDIAVEMQYTGKGDPSMGVFVEVPGFNNPVELDWINRTDNGIELIDVKNIAPSGSTRSAYDIRPDMPEVWPGQRQRMTDSIINEATRQLAAMDASGADGVVWRVAFPPGSDPASNQAIADAIQQVFDARVAQDPRFASITVEIVTGG